MMSSKITSRIELRDHHQGQELLGEHERARAPALDGQAREHRHEGGVERALGQQGAEMVGQPEGDEEGVRDRPGAQQRGGDDVADEAEHAADQRQAADRQDVAQHGADLVASPRAVQARSAVGWCWQRGM